MGVPVVETSSGKLSGRTDAGVHSFLGVQYGAPPVGERRFRPPVPPVPWTGVREATTLGPTAPQDMASVASLIPPELTEARGRAAPPPMGEDCLVLNVWTSALDDGRRPVLVWFHGGAFISGTGSNESGARLAARGDAVVVTLNHRLNLLGFMNLDALAPDQYAGSGVAGALDMVAALQWIHDNIAGFGGDPGNATIFGCSGGALKVSTLLAMPRAEGLIHRAISQSAPYLQAVEPDIAALVAERALKELGLTTSTLDQLHEVPVEQLLAAQKAALAGIGSPMVTGWDLWTMGPVVGNPELPVHPFEPTVAPTGLDVPLIIGHTANEGTMGTIAMYPSDDAVTDDDVRDVARQRFGDDAAAVLDLYSRTRPGAAPIDLVDAMLAPDPMFIDCVRIAERKAATGRAAAYLYRFDYQSEALGGRIRATHGMEVPFVFDDVESTAITGSRPARRELARVMSTTWVTFARDGDPNHDALPQWPPYAPNERGTMVFDEECRLEPDRTELREGLEAIGVGFNPRPRS